MFKIDQAKLLELQKASEREWRNAELAKVDIQVNRRIDADDPSASSWKGYRVALRDWPDHADFPNSLKRPVSP